MRLKLLGYYGSLRILLLCVCLLAAAALPGQVSLLDMTLKAPPVDGTFTVAGLANYQFPVYTKDVRQLVTHTIALAKKFDRERQACAATDTFVSGRSCLLVRRAGQNGEPVCTVTLVTKLEKSEVRFDLFANVTDTRDMQRRLIAFAEYLNGGL